MASVPGTNLVFFPNVFPQAKEKDFKHFHSVIYINASENLLPLGKLFFLKTTFCLLADAASHLC